jgi:hypothetical protein
MVPSWVRRGAIACALFVPILSLVPLVPGVARADESDDALAHGVALRRERRDAEALAEFQRAYALTHAPRALAQIALAEASLGKWVAAESDLARALVANDDWISRQRAALQVALEEIQGHLGALDVASAPGTEVWIDGELAGHAPIVALRVAEGHRLVELRAAGMESSKQEIDVRAGETAHAEASLAPARIEVPEPAPPPPPPVKTLTPAEPRTPSNPGHAQRLFAWGAAGGAVLFAGGGVAATVWTANSAAHYNDNAQCDRPGEPRSVQCASTASAVRTGEALEAVGYGLAGAAAVASVLLFLTAPRAEPGHARGFCAPSIGGAWCTYEF